jgi:cell division protein FtsZ
VTNAKRASMREGPLAALFRSTEELDEPAADAPRREQPADEQRDEQPAEPAQPKLEASEPAVPDPAKARSRRDGAHPSLRAQTAAADEAAERTSVPTPRERLRHAFSSEIPRDIMESRGTGAPSVRERSLALDQSRPSNNGQPLIRVVGVGGAGVNAVNRMVEAEVHGVEFVAINTDMQSLEHSTADATLHIGADMTRGLGSGSDPSVGRQAAMDDYDHIKALLKNSDMIFIAAGAGGGTGSGAAPIVARIAREVGALTVAIVTKPFGFEGSRRGEQAERGVEALAGEVDTLIVVPNNRLLSVLDKQTAIVEAFRVADDVLRQGVQGISDLVTLPGLINLDFADVRTIMSDAGNALLGIGMGVGESRAIDAAVQAVASPLLETSMDGARSILLSITGGPGLSLWEVNEAAKSVAQAAHPDANIIFGAMVDDKLDDQVWVTVVATGYGDQGRRRSMSRLQEPAGEPRVQRTSAGRRERLGVVTPSGSRRGLAVGELDVPEFIPEF